MRNRITFALLAALTLALCGVAQDASAQTRDLRLISARAGGINFVAGEVSLTRAGTDYATALTMKDDLREGDLVKTGANGRVEVLLSPGSYLRVGENAEFTMADESLDRLFIKLARGTAVVEALATDGAQPVIALDAGRTKVIIVRGGIYHVEASADGAAEVAVFKGRALVGLGAAVVKEGRKAVVTQAGAVEVVKFDKKREADTLDAWSRERAEMLAKANGRFRRDRELATALQSMDAWGDYWTSGRSYGWLRTGGWYRGGSRNGAYGYWVYDSFTGSWAFIPLYGWQVSCPYGYGLNTMIVMGPPPKNSAVPCRGCPSVKLVDYRPPYNPGFGTASDDFSRSGGGKLGGGPSPYPAPSAPQPSFDKAPKADPGSAPSRGSGKFPQ
jgi:FecR protein